MWTLDLVNNFPTGQHAQAGMEFGTHAISGAGKSSPVLFHTTPIYQALSGMLLLRLLSSAPYIRALLRSTNASLLLGR